MKRMLVKHLDKSETRSSWSPLAAVLRRYGLDGTVAWILDALGPLTVLGAQILSFWGTIPAFITLFYQS